MAPVFCCYRICKLLVKLIILFCWHRGVPGLVGVMSETPGLRDFTILCVTFPLISLIIKWDVTVMIINNMQ